MPSPRSMLLAAALTLLAIPSAAADGRPNVALAGTLSLPATATEGGPELTGLSGVTWLGDDRYAAILDNSDRLLLFRLAVSRAGEPERVFDLELVTLGERHDYEDVAPCPPALAERIAARRRDRGDPVPDTCLLLAEEDTPAIRAIDLARGDLLGIVPIPELFMTRRPNRGLEALASDPNGRFIWTATEEALPADGPSSGIGQATVVRIARIAVPGSGDTGGQFAYRVEPPHTFARIFAGEPLAGLVALAALGDGRLLVLERSGAPGLPPFKSRIALVDTRRGRDVSDLPGGLADRPETALAKDVLWEDALGCNLEGLCLGPRLSGGRQLLVAVADNGGLGTPTQLVTFVLTEPDAAVDVSAVGVAAAVAGTALLLLRLTSPSPCSTR